MGTWNYRVVRTDYTDGEPPTFAIHEVYYKVGRAVGPDAGADGIRMWSGAVSPQGDDLSELGRDLALMQEALTKPTLLAADLPTSIPDPGKDK